MNRKQRKLKYIRLKNNWRLARFDVSKPIVITIEFHHNFEVNPKYPANEIHMDFKNKEEILRYGVKCVYWRNR